MNSLFLGRYTAAIILVLFFAGTSVAQEGDRIDSFNRGSQYFLGDRDEILMNVNVWGYVLKPGQYLVPRHTDLITLISFAGGPKEGANLSEVKIIRELTSEMTNGHDDGASNRSNGQTKIPILTVSLNDHIKKGKANVLPLLQAGDTVIIPESGGHKVQKFLGFSSVFGIVATMASIAIIVERLSK